MRASFFFPSFATALVFCSFAPGAIAADREGAIGLLADVERIIAAQSGWFLDREEMREIYPTVLQSVCRATPEARKEALATLESRADEAGDPRQLFEEAGDHWTSEAKEAASIDRQLRALEAAVDAAEADCPFWVKPEKAFSGRQTDRNKLTLSLETGGMAQLRQTDGTLTIGGGGAGRLLPGYGFGDFTLLAGVEFGGGALIIPRSSPTEFAINFFPAIPVVFRFRDVEWHYDVELAPVGLFQADDSNVSYGARVATGLGVSVLRTRGFLPWAGVALSYEYYFASGGRPQAHFVRGGVRVGFMWDP